MASTVSKDIIQRLEGLIILQDGQTVISGADCNEVQATILHITLLDAEVKALKDTLSKVSRPRGRSKFRLLPWKADE